MSTTTAFAPAPGAVARQQHAADVEQRVAEIMGIINTATADLVKVIAEAIDTGAWEGWGVRSPQHWVTWRCGVSPSRARRLVAMAKRLEHLPTTARTFATGALTEDQTSVVCRHTPPSHDPVVAELATRLTVPQLQRTLPSLPQPAQPAADAIEPTSSPTARPVEERREVSFGWRDDGLWWMRALLPADEGAVVQSAIEAARNAEFNTRHPDGFGGRRDDDGPSHDSTLAAAAARDRITWSDALCRLATAGFDALTAHHEADGRPETRTQVIVHVDADGDVPPRIHLGPLLPQSTVDELSCDTTVRAILERGSRPVGVGRSRRTVPPTLRMVIEHRDGGCRVPGCSQVRWLHVHHLVHWAAGGRTEPSNLVSLCPAHHRMLHQGRLHVRGDPETPDGLIVTDPSGRPVTPPRPKPPECMPRAAAVREPDRRATPDVGHHLELTRRARPTAGHH